MNINDTHEGNSVRKTNKVKYPKISPKKVEVKSSNIENAGDGLFAMENIASGTIFMEYTGYFQDTANISEEESDIALKVGYNLMIIGDNNAMKINDIVDLRRINDDEVESMISSEIIPTRNLEYNCKFTLTGEGEFARAYVESLKDINQGDELYIEYGFSYWISRFIRLNLINVDFATKHLTEQRYKKRSINIISEVAKDS